MVTKLMTLTWAASVRFKIPLMLAWALTIHKSQGQTLEYVRVDLAGTFDYGQGEHIP